MGNLKQKWTQEEEDALRAGINKHGTGKWKIILTDPEFAASLANRSNIDLKDKWRNMCVSGSASGSRERAGIPRFQGLTIGSPLSSPNPVSAIPLLEYDSTADPSESSQHKQTAPKYDAMIFEAILSLKDSDGPDPDVNAIHDFIEEMYEVPPNFRRFLTTRLRRLVLKGQLVKVGNCFKMKEAASGTKTPGQNDMQVAVVQALAGTETLEDASSYASYKVTASENKSYLLADACEHADAILNMKEDTDTMLMLAQEIYDKCSTSRNGRLIIS